MRRTVVAALVVLLTVSGFGRPAAGAGTSLELSYLAAAGYAVAVKLRCDPAGGGHPHPWRACRTLQEAAGQPARIKLAKTMCMLVYDPVTAQVKGQWRGRPISWEQVYGNTCEMKRATGSLFVF